MSTFDLRDEIAFGLGDGVHFIDYLRDNLGWLSWIELPLA